MLVFSIVSLSPPPSACLSYLSSLSVIFILFLSLFYPLPPLLLFSVFFSSCFSFSSPLLPFLVTSLFFLFSFFLSPHFFPFFSQCLPLFLLFSFLSDLPPSLFVSLPCTSPLSSSHQVRTRSRVTGDEKGFSFEDHRFCLPSTSHSRTSCFQHEDSK